jgi:hypothetical protein
MKTFTVVVADGSGWTGRYLYLYAKDALAAARHWRRAGMTIRLLGS